MTHIEQYAIDLHQDVLQKSGGGDNPTLREEAFTEIVLETLSEHNEADNADLCTFEARGTRAAPAAKLSAWALSGDGATLDLFLSRYFGTGKPESVPKAEARKCFELLDSFLTRAISGNHTRMEESSPAFEAALRIHEARDNLSTVRLFVLSDGVLRIPDDLKFTHDGIDVQPVVWDLDKLSNLRVGQRSVVKLDFVNNYDGAINCIQTSDDLGEYRTYLAFMRAPLLAKIYGTHGQRLLERNVRAFLQSKGKINRGLQKTIKEQPNRFLAYNNGLCCTAAEVDVEVDAQGNARLKSVTDFQIVNGGQTTASIHHALKKERVDVNRVVVQVKLTVINSESKLSEMVPLISQYANSQNRINTADFSANGPFHQKIEQMSRSVWAPASSGIDRQTRWYYERARGSYADDRGGQSTPAKRREWERQNPPHQKFTKTDLAKYELSWQGKAHFVCLGADKAFLRHAEGLSEGGEPAVIDQTYFKHLVAKAILFRTTEKIFSEQPLSQLRAQSVAYTVAWFAQESDSRIDLDRIWAQQRLPPGLCEALAVGCRLAHKHIGSQSGNPTEACKRLPCWESFRVLQMPVGDAWRKELAENPFVPPSSDEEALAMEWDRVRQGFVADERTVGKLEVLTGKQWIAKRRKDPVLTYAKLSWEGLSTEGLGPVKRRGLLELLAAATEVP
jgi:hypothetical protein